jgi:clan AA aspartic protease
MGLIYTDITLSNPRNPNLKPITVKALADSGAVTLCIPQHVAVQLELETLEMREVSTADGSSRPVPYAGPIQVAYGNRSSFCGAFVMGDEPLLGAIQMEDMDLVLNMRDQKITTNPASPNMARAIVK